MHRGIFVFMVGATFIAANRGLAAAARPSVATTTANTDLQLPPASGLTKETVVTRLGMPSQIVSPELWVYREFYTDHQAAAQRGFDTLVIRFVGNRVDKLRVVNGEALTALLENIRRARATSVAVAPSPRATP
jgi:hypothetical protein